LVRCPAQRKDDCFTCIGNWNPTTGTHPPIRSIGIRRVVLAHPCG
jgi:hypothetical protein